MNNCLLPYKFKWIGALLVLFGSIVLVFYVLYNLVFMLPVFAVFSSFLETKVFAIIKTNIADELIMLALLSGFFFMAFSKEKTENENMPPIRANALSKAVFANTVFLIFSILFIYGNGFVAMILLNLVSPFIFYLVFLFILKRKFLRSQDRVRIF